MQEISPSRYVSISETDGALIAAVRGIARSMSFFVSSWVGNQLGRVHKTLFQSPADSLVNRHEIAIMYFGRTSEFLMMTSERIVIPTGCYTLGQLLCHLHKRGGRWAEELDDSHLVCTVNGHEARLFDTIRVGDEVCFSSTKSIFEA